jgi:MerR family copper efflux transcriptional regulator
VGFTLSDVHDLLSLRTAPGVTCADVKAKAARKIDEIEDRIAELIRMKLALARLAAQCTGRGGLGTCPILDALDSDESD